MVRIRENGKSLPPLTPEERERALALLERIRLFRETLLAERGGQ